MVSYFSRVEVTKQRASMEKTLALKVVVSLIEKAGYAFSIVLPPYHLH
jgi:hypothetical protein